MHIFCENPALKNGKKFRFNAQFAEKSKIDVDFDHSFYVFVSDIFTGGTILPFLLREAVN